MSKDIKNLEKMLEIYAIASRKEKDSHDFYADAAEEASSKPEKETFLELAKFEMEHFKLMQEKYDATLKKIEELKKG